MIKEITLTHLRRAIRERNKAKGKDYDCGRTCLIAQAAKEVYGKKNLETVGIQRLWIRREVGPRLGLRLPKTIQRLIGLFDYSVLDFPNGIANMAKLRAILPVRVRFPKAA